MSSDGVRIAYARVGQGPPLVKAANYVTHLTHDWKGPVWSHWLRELTRDHTLIRYDERGCGLSDWDVPEYSLEAWASVPFEEGRRLAALIPDSRFVALESKNHILLESEPAWQRFLAEMHAFLSSSEPEVDPDVPPEPFPELTPRERDVLDLVARGLSDGEIAEELAIAGKTVRNHVTRIYSKLYVGTRARAIVLAREAGLGRIPHRRRGS